MCYNKTDFERAKKEVDIKDVLASYGIYPNRNGKYKCPFHDDKHPSGSVKFNQFKCFSTCGKSWNVINFVMEMENCDKKTALAYLDKKYKLGMDTYLPREEYIKKMQKERECERQKLEREKWEQFKVNTLNQLSIKMRRLEKNLDKYHITQKQYQNGWWWGDHKYFINLKEYDRICYIYDAICELAPPECEYTYTYGEKKSEILKKIACGEIKI